MGVETWIEMPVVSNPALLGGSARPQYDVPGNAILVYRGEKVYVASQSERAAEELGQLVGVRQLSVDEARVLEASLPGVGIARLHSLGSDSHSMSSTGKRLRLGDAVTWITRRLGIQECDACRQRKEKLNRIAWWRLSAR